MKKLLLLAITIIVCLCLTACGGQEEPKTNDNNAQNGEVNNQETSNYEEPAKEETEPLTREVKSAKIWMSLPENVDMYWRVDEKNTSNYSIAVENKRGNNVMYGSEGWDYGVPPQSEANKLTNHYYYYEYKGDYKWDSYAHFYDKGWDTHYFKGNYPASPQTFCMGRQYVIQDNYTNEHVTINIEGLGDVDTVKGTMMDYGDKEYTVYYSEKLGFNVKVENTVQAWYLTKFDTNVGSSFPHALPNQNEIAANSSQTYDDYVIDDDEIIEFDDVPNGPLPEDIIVTKVDESAEGLVFAYYQKKDAQLTFGDVLTNYTKDYTEIRTGSGKQRGAFLGFKLDENDRIQRAYACVIYKGVLYALEGTTDGSKYESNKAIMNKMYEAGEIEDKGYRYSAMLGGTHADVWSDGRASTFHEAGAQIDSHGKIYCD